MNKQDQYQLPEWFEGEVYNKGGTVQNVFTGEKYILNNLELSMYDFIMGSQMIMELNPGNIEQPYIDEFHKGLKWFRESNPKAYMVLLD